MRPYAPAGSRCSTCSTRLTTSTYSCQSSVAHRRRLVIALATDAWRDALALVLAANRVLGGGLPRGEVLVDGDADRRQPHAVFADAVQELDDERGVGSRRQGSAACSGRLSCARARSVGGAPGRARSRAVSSARRRRFSISASFNMLGHAQSSPIVSGATR